MTADRNIKGETKTAWLGISDLDGFQKYGVAFTG